MGRAAQPDDVTVIEGEDAQRHDPLRPARRQLRHGTGELLAAGAVRFTGHDGLLDLRIADAKLVLARGGATTRMKATL